MIISKKLKFLLLDYDTDDNTLDAITVDPASRDITGHITIPRHYMFSLIRFIIRIAQKGRKRRR